MSTAKRTKPKPPPGFSGNTYPFEKWYAKRGASVKWSDYAENFSSFRHANYRNAKSIGRKVSVLKDPRDDDMAFVRYFDADEE